MDNVRDSKEYSSMYITQSELIARQACDLSEVIITAGGNTGYLRVYDGESTQGELKFVLKVPSDTTRPIGLRHDVYFRRGLYIEIVEQVDHCTILWRDRLAKEG